MPVSEMLPSDPMLSLQKQTDLICRPVSEMSLSDPMLSSPLSQPRSLEQTEGLAGPGGKFLRGLQLHFADINIIGGDTCDQRVLVDNVTFFHLQFGLPFIYTGSPVTKYVCNMPLSPFPLKENPTDTGNPVIKCISNPPPKKTLQAYRQSSQMMCKSLCRQGNLMRKHRHRIQRGNFTLPNHEHTMSERVHAFDVQKQTQDVQAPAPLVQWSNAPGATS
eukprot:1150295-Pelagomonas_calceolata.AAC.8